MVMTLTAKAGRSSTTVQWHPIFGLPHDRLYLSIRTSVRWCYSVVVITRDFDWPFYLPETQVRTLVAPWKRCDIFFDLGESLSVCKKRFASARGFAPLNDCGKSRRNLITMDTLMRLPRSLPHYFLISMWVELYYTEHILCRWAESWEKSVCRVHTPNSFHAWGPTVSKRRCYERLSTRFEE